MTAKFLKHITALKFPFRSRTFSFIYVLLHAVAFDALSSQQPSSFYERIVEIQNLHCVSFYAVQKHCGEDGWKLPKPVNKTYICVKNALLNFNVIFSCKLCINYHLFITILFFLGQFVPGKGSLSHRFNGRQAAMFLTIFS